MTKQLTQALKGYFRNEEFSDKVLHIIEMEGAVKLRMNLRDDFLEGSDEDKDDSSDEDSCSDKSELNVSDEQSETDDLPAVESDSNESKNDSNELNTSPTDGSKEKSGSVPDDEVANKIFNQCSFFMSKNILGHDIEKVQKLVQNHGGEFINLKESANYIISHYLLPKKRNTADSKERTIQWVEDCLTENEIKVSFVNVLYRPISVKSKPLSNLVLTFGKCEEKEKNLLQQIAERLGAAHQNLLFTRHNNNNATVSTHFVICREDKSDSIQFNTAMEWSIPCVTKQWLLKCSETLEKLDETNYSVESIICTNVGDDTVMNETSNGHSYSVFPVHSWLLLINSDYFKALTSDSGLRESNYKHIVVKVNPGGGRFLELLIHSIYDQNVLDELSIVELLKVLELADQFLCDLLIEYGLEILDTLNIEALSECNEILEQVQVFKSLSSVLSNKIYESMTNLCANFLAEYFYQLECCPEIHDDFVMVPFVSILLLLKSGLSFLHHENSVIYFVVTWLSVDEERQTEYNIKKLLNKVRYEHITVGYFKNVLLIDKVLSKWSGFYQWCANALLYHGFSEEDKSLQGLNCASKNRSINTSTVQSYVIKLEYFLEESIFKTSEYSKGKVIYQGYIFTPLITFVKNVSSSYDLNLNVYFDDDVTKKEMKKFYLKFGIAVCVFPGNKKLPKVSVKVHFRRFKVEYIKCNSFEKNIGTIDEEIYNTFKEEGIDAWIVFGGLKQVDWPESLKALNDVKNLEIHRKSIIYADGYVYPGINSCFLKNGKYF